MENQFRQYPLEDDILGALDALGYTQPTEIQAAVIPSILNGRDIIAKSKTGSGKTAAFAIPICNFADWEQNTAQALVLEPTRELAFQVKDELYAIGRFKRLKVPVLYGGFPMEKQILTLKQKTHIVVGTPGRVLDHCKRGTLDLSKVRYVVIDEADLMLDMGFIHDVTRILDKIPHRKNLGMFSATISREVMDISWVYQRDPVEIVVRADEQNKPDIQQYRIAVDRGEKVDITVKLLEAGSYERAIAFCNTKNMTDRLSGLLKMRGISCEAIHGDIMQRIREKTLEKFKRGEIRVLVATDVAARGLDIDDVDAVFNYDVPDELENYTHRIGRTGRARKHGVAYTFVTNVTEGIRMDDIIRNTKAEVQRLKYDEDGCLILVEENQK